MKPIDWHATYETLAIDVETTGRHWYRDRVFAIAIAGRRGPGADIEAGYFDLRRDDGVILPIKRLISRAKRVVNHYIKFDDHFLRGPGLSIEIPDEKIECTGARAALIDEHRFEYSLDAVAKDCIGRRKVDIYEDLAKIFGGPATRSAQMKHIANAPYELVSKYAIEDPIIALELWEWQEKEIEKQELSQVWNLERRLLPVLARMERRGVPVDEALVQRRINDTRLQIERAEVQIENLAGFKLNVNSHPQLMKAFAPKFDEERRGWFLADGTPLAMTDAGKPSFAVDTMRETSLPIGKAIARLRKLQKALQFLTGHIGEHLHNGFVHPNFNQTKTDRGVGTGTGRLSCDDPAMQQIPARDVEMAEIVRSCFVSGRGRKWVCADWAQFEFRWFAHYTKNETLELAYLTNPDVDFHKLTADITGLPRSPRYAGDANAKQINLGLVFGMGEGTLAMEMGLPYTMVENRGKTYAQPGDEARDVFARYHSAIPGVKKLLQNASNIAKSRGHVNTIMGRRIRFPRGMFVHKAAGLVFQGTSADCMKVKLIELDERFRDRPEVQLILSVHDETDTLCPEGMAQEVGMEVKEVMETFDGERCPIKCRIPIRSEIGIADNWFDASK